MPRLPVILLVLLALAHSAAASATVPALVQGSATVTDFYVRSNSFSYAFDGALHQRHLACTDCFLNLTLSSGGIVVRQGAMETALGPGIWQFRDFSGSMAYDKIGTGVWRFHLDGSAAVRYVGPA